MYLAEIVLQDLFDPSVMEAALSGTSTLWTSATPITAATAKNSTLIYILVSVVVVAVAIIVILAFLESQKQQQEAAELPA